MYLTKPEGDIEFKREVGEKEGLLESVTKTFEPYGLDVSELVGDVKEVKEEESQIVLCYILETDPLSLLEYLVGDGRETGLELREGV